jgi:hypothetical protein
VCVGLRQFETAEEQTCCPIQSQGQKQNQNQNQVVSSFFFFFFS